MIPGQGYKAVGQDGQVTASGLPIAVPSVNQPGNLPAVHMGNSNGLMRSMPGVRHVVLAHQRNALQAPDHTGVENVPGQMIQPRQGGTVALTTGVGDPRLGMAGMGKGLMARNWDAMPSQQTGADVSEIFYNQNTMPRPTTLVMPNIVATARAGLGVYTEMTPTSLNQRLPSIVNDSPQDLNAAAQANCSTLSSFVSQNEILAVGGLVFLAYLLFKK